MDHSQDLYARVSNIRNEAFELIHELSQSVDEGNADPLRMLALVRLQAVANNLGRVQSDLRAEGCEQVRLLDL